MADECWVVDRSEHRGSQIGAGQTARARQPGIDRAAIASGRGTIRQARRAKDRPVPVIAATMAAAPTEYTVVERSGEIISRDGDLVVVDYPPYGRFSVLTVSTDAPRYVSYRSAESNQPPGDGTSTLVEFFLTEQGAGTVLRVVESGFASLPLSAEERAAEIEDNIDGWEQQLGFAKRDAERTPA